MADSIWQEKNERSVVSSGYTPLAISSSKFFEGGMRGFDRIFDVAG